MKLSVILPIFNAEKYLSRCIESIISQDFFELILINDGSVDKSGEICEIYQKNDSRIKVFHQQNQGVSVARNVGILNSTGDWIAFVDADDWVSDDWYKILNQVVQESNDCDIIAFGFKRIKNDIERFHIYKSELLSASDFLLGNVSPFGWSYIYKKTIINKFQLKFPVGLKLSEDQVFVLKYLSISKNIMFTDKVLYNYFEHEESAVSKSAGKELTLNSLWAANDFLKFANNKDISKRIKLKVTALFYEEYFWYYSLLKEKKCIGSKQQKDFKSEYEKTLMLFSDFRKNKHFYLASFSVPIAFYLHKIIQKLKKILYK